MTSIRLLMALSSAMRKATSVASPANHGDPEHLWNQLKTGYTMDGFRKAVKAAMGEDTSADTGDTATKEYPEKLTSGYYRVRKTWADSKSQVGAYRILSNAKAKADENEGYSVFDNDGNVAYAPSATKDETETQDGSSILSLTVCASASPI